MTPSPVNSWLRASFAFKENLPFLPASNSTSISTFPAPTSNLFTLDLRTIALTLSVVAAAWVIHTIGKSRKKTLPPLPPGPKPLPILGNLLDVPTKRDYETYTKWKEVYGDVIYLSALGNDIIILNSVKAASDLLDKRSLSYSDRPYIPMIHEDSLMGFNWTLIFMNYSTAWRRQRRLFAQYIPNSASAPTALTYRPRQISSAHHLLRNLLKTSTPSTSDPYSYRSQMRHVFANVLLGIAYGYDVQPEDDSHIDLCERSVQLVNIGINPGTYLVNLFPILKHIPAWMPFNYAKAHGKLVRKTHTELKERPMALLKSKLASGTAAPSFATNALMEIDTKRAEALAQAKIAHSIVDDKDNENDISENDVKHIAASMYGAGFDTAFAPLLCATLNLLLNPSVQQKAHAELDTVIGSPNSSTFRLPTWEDRPRLPYINAILAESLRWLPPSPGGLPHSLSRSFDPLTRLTPSSSSPSEPSPTNEYDTYRNYRIPRGSMIITNVWAMLRDPEVYHDPDTFKPERFLREEYTDEEGNVHVLREAEPHPSEQGVFGFGRRACPGQYLGQSIIWIELVNLIASFEIIPALDEAGKPIDVSWAKTPIPAYVLHPPAFPCLFKPRSDIVVQRIMETEA